MRNMQPVWANEPSDDTHVSADQRGAVLVDLLGLVDALPATPIGELAFPPFHTLRREH